MTKDEREFLKWLITDRKHITAERAKDLDSGDFKRGYTRGHSEMSEPIEMLLASKLSKKDVKRCIRTWKGDWS